MFVFNHIFDSACLISGFSLHRNFIFFLQASTESEVYKSRFFNRAGSEMLRDSDRLRYVDSQIKRQKRDRKPVALNLR